LSGSTLSVDHTVINKGDGAMYFSLGGHPAFNCPVHNGDKYSDHYLEFEEKETDSTWLLNSDGLVSNEQRPILKNSKILPLHDHLFDDDALIFKNLNSRRVSLVSKKSGRILSMDYNGFPYLGIWAKPGAPFVCIEPWQGIADSEDTSQEFTQKEGIMAIDSGEEHRAGYSVTFHI
jgi:galactose mutarotase-like enzyme